MENMNEDVAFFKMLANVTEKTSNNISKVNSSPKVVDAKEFWSQVDFEYIELLGEAYAYKYDLEMFGYSIGKYLENIELEYIK